MTQEPSARPGSREGFARPKAAGAATRRRSAGLMVGLAVVTVLIVSVAGVVTAVRFGPAVAFKLISPGSAASGAPSGGSGMTPSTRPSTDGQPGTDSRPSTAGLARVIVTPGTGLLKGWQDTSSLGQGLTPDNVFTDFCNQRVPLVTATETAGSIGMWLAASDLQPKGQTLREFDQGLGRVGVRVAQSILTQVRTSISACHSYQVSPTPNPMDDVSANTIRPDPQVQVGDESLGVWTNQVDTSKAGRINTFSYAVVFRVGDVLASTAASSGIPLTDQDVDLIRSVALEEVRRLRQG